MVDPRLSQLLTLDAVWDRGGDGSEATADALLAAITAERGAERAPTARRRRRLRRVGPAMVGAAAALAAAATVGALRDDDRTEQPADVVVTMSATDLAPGARATASVTARPLGTVIRIDASGLPPAEPGTYYEAWMHRDSTVVSAGTFHMRGGDGAVYLWSGVDAAEYPLLTVTVQAVGDVAPSDRLVLRAVLD